MAKESIIEECREELEDMIKGMIREEVDEDIKYLTAIEVEKEDLDIARIDLKTVVEMILDHLKLEVTHRKEIVLTKLEKKGGNDAA